MVSTNGQKFDILDYFAHRVENVELGLESSCECIENIVGLI